MREFVFGIGVQLLFLGPPGRQQIRKARTYITRWAKSKVLDAVTWSIETCIGPTTGHGSTGTFPLTPGTTSSISVLSLPPVQTIMQVPAIPSFTHGAAGTASEILATRMGAMLRTYLGRTRYSGMMLTQRIHLTPGFIDGPHSLHFPAFSMPTISLMGHDEPSEPPPLLGRCALATESIEPDWKSPHMQLYPPGGEVQFRGPNTFAERAERVCEWSPTFEDARILEAISRIMGIVTAKVNAKQSKDESTEAATVRGARLKDGLLTGKSAQILKESGPTLPGPPPPSSMTSDSCIHATCASAQRHSYSFINYASVLSPPSRPQCQRTWGSLTSCTTPTTSPISGATPSPARFAPRTRLKENTPVKAEEWRWECGPLCELPTTAMRRPRKRVLKFTDSHTPITDSNTHKQVKALELSLQAERAAKAKAEEMLAKAEAERDQAVLRVESIGNEHTQALRSITDYQGAQEALQKQSIKQLTALSEAAGQLKKVEAERDEAWQRIKVMEAEHMRALECIEQYEGILAEHEQRFIQDEEDVARLTALVGKGIDNDYNTGSKTPTTQDQDVLRVGMTPIPEGACVMEGAVKAPSGYNGRDTDLDSATDIGMPAGLAKSAFSAAAGVALEGEYAGRKEWQAAMEDGMTQGWLLSPDEVTLKQELGRGSFGTTFLGELRGKEVAVKCVRVQKDQEATSFLRELKALLSVVHPNVMALRGAVIQPPSACWLVANFLPGGTLVDWLYGQPGQPAPERSMVDKLTMGLGIARGMLALQKANPPILHRDLKPANVMLDSASRPHIADFGLSREHLEDVAYTYTGETGTYTYMSPEMMRNELYGLSTNVFSFGVLLAEVLQQRPPYLGIEATPADIAGAVADGVLLPEILPGTTGGLDFLLTTCWGEAELRPDFEFIVFCLEDALKEQGAGP